MHIREVAPRSQPAGRIQVRPQIHHRRTDDPQDHRRGQHHQRLRGQRADDVVQKPRHARCEDPRLALLRAVALHHANAAQRLGQPPRHLGVDLGPLAEDGPDGLERPLQDQHKCSHNHERQKRHAHAHIHEIRKCKQRRQHAADEVHHARPNQVAHALHVGHDARHQGAGAVLVVKRHRQPPDMRLHLHAQLGNQPLPLGREQLRQGIRRQSLDQRRRQHRPHDIRQQPHPVLGEHQVNQRTRRIRQNQRARPIHNHQDKTARQQPAPRLGQLPYLGQHLLQIRLGTLGGQVGDERAPNAPAGPVRRVHPAAHPTPHAG